MLKLSINAPNSILVQWGDEEGDTFRLSRSTAQHDGYELLATNIQTPMYIDKDVNLYDVGSRYYYKVEGFVGGVKVSESKSETASYNKRDPIANKVIHEAEIVLRVMNNPPVKVLLKRRHGKRCPECWNPITKKVRFANCSTCNGTGILEGYHKPITTKISRDFSQLIDYSSMLDGEKVNRSAVNAWISNVPLVTPGDVIVDVMDQRFYIERVVQRTRSQYVIRQVIDIIPLEKGHPAYLIDVDWSDELE